MSDDLHDLSFRFFPIFSIRSQFHHNFMSVHCSSWFFNRYKYILIQSLIIRNYKSKLFARLHTIQSDHFRKSTLQDLHNLSFTASSLRLFCQHNLDMVSVERPTDIIFSDKYICRTIFIQYNKTESLKACTEYTGQTLCMSFTVLSSLGKINLSFLFQWFQYLAQLIPVFFCHTQKHGQFLKFHRCI